MLKGSDFSQWIRGHTELVVLSLLNRQPLHGYGLFLVLRESKPPIFTLNRWTLHPLLRRFEKAGWITGRWERGLSRHPQKVYRLTPTGQTHLKKREAQWKDLCMAVENLLNLTPEKMSHGTPLQVEEGHLQSRKPKKRPNRTDDMVHALLTGHIRKRLAFNDYRT